MSDAMDRATAETTWQIVLIAQGTRVQVQWSPNLHPESVPIVLLDQARQLLEAQQQTRQQAAPMIVVPRPGNGGFRGGAPPV